MKILALLAVTLPVFHSPGRIEVGLEDTLTLDANHVVICAYRPADQDRKVRRLDCYDLEPWLRAHKVKLEPVKDP